jgi:hypothetical protein
LPGRSIGIAGLIVRIRAVLGTVGILLGIVGVASSLTVTPARAEVIFERMEVTLGQPITGWLHGDIDRDGDSDLLFLHQRDVIGAPTHTATLILQNPTGRYDFPGRQVFGLQDSGGVYELADVAAGSHLELVQVSRTGVRYFEFIGEHFDTVPKVLFEPAREPDLPVVSEPRAWDCGWPIFPNGKESLTIPFVDRLEIWTADQSGRYSLAHTFTSLTLDDQGSSGLGTAFTYALPTVMGGVSPTDLELFVRSGQRWHGFRRSGLDKVDFESHVAFGCMANAPIPYSGLGRQFDAGALMIDLNNDGALDAVRWNSPGSLNQTRFEAEIYFGPIRNGLPTTPHSQISVEGVAGFPEFGDFNGDGRLDMVVCAMEVAPLATAKVFVMKKVKLYLLGFRQRTDNTFSVVRDVSLDFDYRLDFDDPAPVTGPLIKVVGDLDGNGTDDLIVQTGEDRIAIYPGDSEELLADSPQRLTCDKAIAIDALDLDGDGRADMFLVHASLPKSQRITALLTR